MLSLLDLSHLLALEETVASSGQPVDWASVLSLGEQQRLAALRVLYHKPRFAVLDEATSSMDPALEERTYALLKNCGVALISVGHRVSLLRYHERVLRLNSTGEWAISKTSEVIN